MLASARRQAYVCVERERGRRGGGTGQGESEAEEEAKQSGGKKTHY